MGGLISGGVISEMAMGYFGVRLAEASSVLDVLTLAAPTVSMFYDLNKALFFSEIYVRHFCPIPLQAREPHSSGNGHH